MSEKIKTAVAAILCGGKSRRMGFDKAFLMDEENYLLQETADRLSSLFEEVVLVSNTKDKFEGRKEFERFIILQDGYIEKGPMGGIATALEAIQTEYVFVMACDMPFGDLDLIERMYRRLEDNQVFICSHEGKMEPLFAFYHKSCLPVFKNHIEMGDLKLRSAFSSLKAGTYFLSEEEMSAVVNLNTQEDVRKWTQK